MDSDLHQMLHHENQVIQVIFAIQHYFSNPLTTPVYSPITLFCQTFTGKTKKIVQLKLNNANKIIECEVQFEYSYVSCA